MYQKQEPSDIDDLINKHQDSAFTDLDINELYKWLERPLTEEDYRID